jgi:hypothetical protein
VLAGAALVTALLAGTVPAAATPGRPAPENPATSQAGAATPTLATAPDLTILQQSTTAAPDGDFVLLFNVRDSVPAGSDFALDVYPRIDDRATFDAAAANRPRRAVTTFGPVPIDAPGAGDRTTGIVLNLYRRGDPVPPGQFALRLDEPGVYPLRIRLRRHDGTEGQVLFTSLVRTADDGSAVPRVPIALVTTVHRPTPAADDTSGLSGRFLERLDALLGTLNAVPDLPMSFAVTPETALAVAEDPDASDTEAALREAIAGTHRELLGAPFVDIDPAQLVRDDLVDELARQAALGAEILGANLEPAAGSSWVVPRRLDAATVAALDRVGVRDLVVPAATVTGAAAVDAGPYRTPGATATRTLVIPEGNDIGTAATADPLLTAHQLYSRLVALRTIDPDVRSVIRLDADGAGADEVLAFLALAADPASLLAPTTVTGLLHDAPEPDQPIAFTPPRDEGPARSATLVRDTNALAASYASMLVDQPERAHRFDLALARSASLDLTVAQRSARLRKVAGEISAALGAVSVPARDRVTLGARNARFPLPIRSQLPGPIHVVVELQASDRLSFPRSRIDVVLDGERTVVQIPVRVRAPGDTPMRISVLAPDGRVLAESRYSVRSTAVSGVGLLLTVGAAAFLALWWGRHWTRSRRGRHATGRVAHGSH